MVFHLDNTYWAIPQHSFVGAHSGRLEYMDQHKNYIFSEFLIESLEILRVQIETTCTFNISLWNSNRSEVIQFHFRLTFHRQTFFDQAKSNIVLAFTKR